MLEGSKSVSGSKDMATVETARGARAEEAEHCQFSQEGICLKN